ncbi:hypothetical protein ACJX0J_015854, partial [Zea mays]
LFLLFLAVLLGMGFFQTIRAVAFRKEKEMKGNKGYRMFGSLKKNRSAKLNLDLQFNMLAKFEFFPYVFL